MATYKKSDLMKNGIDISKHFETNEEMIAKGWEEAELYRNGRSIDELRQQCNTKAGSSVNVSKQVQAMAA